MDKHRKNDIKASMVNWTSFHPIVATLTLEEVEFATKEEVRGANRTSFLNRLQKRRRRLLVEQVREDNNNT